MGWSNSNFFCKLCCRIPHVPRLHAVDTDLSQSAAEKLGDFLSPRPSRGSADDALRSCEGSEMVLQNPPEPIESCPSCWSRPPRSRETRSILRNSQRGNRRDHLLTLRQGACAAVGQRRYRYLGTESADTDVSPSTWDEAVEGERLLN